MNTQLTFALKLKDAQRASDKPKKKKKKAKAEELDAVRDAANAEEDSGLMFAMDL
jgi:hypothetical protein